MHGGGRGGKGGGGVSYRMDARVVRSKSGVEEGA